MMLHTRHVHLRNHQTARKALLLLLALLPVVAMVSCGGGGGGHRHLQPAPGYSPPAEDRAQPPGRLEAQQQLDQYLQEQVSGLTTWPSATYGSIKGTLSIEGYTMLDPISLEPLPLNGAIGAVPLRVVDPEDDVDSIVFPDADGRFLFPDLPTLEGGTLYIKFLAAEDVDGDGRGIDMVECAVPVRVASARQTTVHIQISPLPSALLDDDWTELAYAYALPIHLSYQYEGPDGARHRELAIFATFDQFYMDADRDGKFTENDLQFDDHNSNGLDDMMEESLGVADILPPAEEMTLGVILSIAGNVVTVRSTEETLPHSFDVNEATTLVDEYGAQISLSAHLVGHGAIAMIQEFPDGYATATLLMVFLNPSPPSNEG